MGGTHRSASRPLRGLLGTARRSLVLDDTGLFSLRYRSKQVGNDRFRLSLLATRRYLLGCGLARTRKKEKKQGRIKGKGEKKRETSTAREPRDGVADENLAGGIFFAAVFSISSSPRLRRLGKEVAEASHPRQEEKMRRPRYAGTKFFHIDLYRTVCSVPRFEISTCTARYGRYIPVRQVAGTRTVRYWAVPPKIDRRRSISAVGGRLREKSIADVRLREKSIVDGRLSKNKGRRRRGKEEKRKEEKKKEHLALARCRYPLAVLARVPSPPTGRGRFFSLAGRKIEATFTACSYCLILQTDQMGRIVNELDTIQFSIKKASQLVKEIGRQVIP
ncbi:hypothetical protein GW17_00013834 [Ensete ventricosum]|nr:hypothetical protein GW17_00013834 [Ensete ventricosum]